MLNWKKLLLLHAVRYLWRWLFSNENNHKQLVDGFDFLQAIREVTTGEDYAAGTAVDALDSIKVMIDAWLDGSYDPDDL